jgi:ABC-type amino acid transport substrate-binding protein
MTQKELIVGLDFAAPIPMHSDISSGVFEGFEVDLMKMISGKLGLTLTYKVSLWRDILQRLEDKTIDVICSAVTVTPERSCFLDFTDPYLSFNLCVVSDHAENITSTDQLRGNSIGVRKATEAEKFIKTHLKDNMVVYSDTNDELYELLNHKKINLVIDDSPIAGAFVKLNENIEISFLLPGTESTYAIAVKKGNEQVRNAMNTVLRQIKKNGVWQSLYDKWFGDS